MKSQHPKNMAVSVRQRLLNLSRERGEDFQHVLLRFALERLLYRLSQSVHGQRFVLKGAMLFALWSDQPHRPTRDLDLWGQGSNSVSTLEDNFREICSTPVEDDGIAFDLETLRGDEIRVNNEYMGVRVQFLALIAGARINIQVDIGFGDKIQPRPYVVRFPTLLPLPQPELQAYPKEAVVAEKYHAMVNHGMANTRMKDFYDLFFMARKFPFQGEILCQAIRSTFENRETPISEEPPLALTSDFYDDIGKNTQWRAFLRKSRLDNDSPSLSLVISEIYDFLMPPSVAIAEHQPFFKSWAPGGSWQ